MWGELTLFALVVCVMSHDLRGQQCGVWAHPTGIWTYLAYMSPAPPPPPTKHHPHAATGDHVGDLGPAGAL